MVVRHGLRDAVLDARTAADFLGKRMLVEGSGRSCSHSKGPWKSTCNEAKEKNECADGWLKGSHKNNGDCQLQCEAVLFCPSGKYSLDCQYPSLACIDCEAGRYGPLTSHESAVCGGDCPIGYFSILGQNECTKCPSGTHEVLNIVIQYRLF